MNRQTWLVLVVVLAFIGGAAWALGNLQRWQRLGVPGVKVLNEPMYGEAQDPSGQKTAFLAGTNRVYLPEQVLNYASTNLPVNKLVWNWLPKDTTYGQRLYTAPDGFDIQTTVVLMGTDRTSIHQPQYCLTGAGFRIDAQEQLTVPVSRPAPYELPVMRITASMAVRNERGQSATIRALYVYWFAADDQLTASHRERMWWMARDLVLEGVLQRWAYVSCFATCLPGQETATFERIKEFIGAAVPHFQLVPKAKASAGVSSLRRPVGQPSWLSWSAGIWPAPLGPQPVSKLLNTATPAVPMKRTNPNPCRKGLARTGMIE